MTLYNLKSALDDYRITKFTSDLDVESSYLLSDTFDDSGRRQLLCECPAGTRPTCRHRQMLSNLIPLVDTEFFWDFERGMSVDANGNPQRATVGEPLHLGEPLITIEGSMPNQFVVGENDHRGEGLAPAVATAPATSWRRI
jgi:hypothetical protein